MPGEKLITAKNIHVSYSGNKALKGIDFVVEKGEIHALIGDHRAGKSSLVNVLSGAVTPDRGIISFKGREYSSFTTREARKLGIGIVYQDLLIIPSLNAVENIFAGGLLRNWFGRVDNGRMIGTCRKIFERLDIDIDPSLPVSELSLGKKYIIEVVRCLVSEPELLIFDEVSNKLNSDEINIIYQILFEYKKNERSVIYITHDFDEINKIADRVTVLKGGYRVETARTSELDQMKLFQLTYHHASKQAALSQDDANLQLVMNYVNEMIDRIPAAVIILNNDNEIKHMNPSAVNFFQNYQAEEDGWDLEAIGANIDKNIFTELREKIRANEYCEYENIIFGEDRRIKIVFLPFSRSGRGSIGKTLMIIDNSIGMYIEKYLINTEKLASIAEIAPGLAHEINTPLCIIQNYLEIIKDSRIDPAMQQKIDRIEGEVLRIDEITGSLLSFSRIRNIELKKVEMATVIDDVAILLQHRFAKKSIKFSRNIQFRSAWVWANENKMKQVLLNMIINSIDAVLDGGEINVSLKGPLSDAYEICIEDNGCGIPEEIRDKIFNPFFTTKITKKNTGLGLSIVKHVINESGGSIEFISTPGEYTRFKISLPVVRERE